jgi:hypothetical protein
MEKAYDILEEYYFVRKRMIDITKSIESMWIDDTKPDTSFGTEPIFLSNHVHDYLEYDKEHRYTYEGPTDFDEYCMDVIGMDGECQTCRVILELIRERAKLRTRLGPIKNKIMILGKKIHPVTSPPTPSTH